MKPTKMRNKMLYMATYQLKSKQLGSALSKALQKRYNKKSARIHKGDHVTIQRGEFKGVTGKVLIVSAQKNSVAIEGIKKEKTKGDKFDVYIHTSNLLITSLDTGDRWRIAKLADKDPRKQIKMTVDSSDISNTDSDASTTDGDSSKQSSDGEEINNDISKDSKKLSSDDSENDVSTKSSDIIETENNSEKLSSDDSENDVSAKSSDIIETENNSEKLSSNDSENDVSTKSSDIIETENNSEKLSSGDSENNAPKETNKDIKEDEQ